MTRDVHMRGFRERTPVRDAIAVLERRVGPLGAEAVPLAGAAGRVAAEDVVARSSVPHFARAAMDGYATAAASIAGASAAAPVTLPVTGDSMPGRPFAGCSRPRRGRHVTTGAPVPEGADAVLVAELAGEVERDGERLLLARAPVAPGKHVGAIGEDVRAGAVVVARGRRLRPQGLGVLASVGAGEILVVRRPTTARGDHRRRAPAAREPARRPLHRRREQPHARRPRAPRRRLRGHGGARPRSSSRGARRHLRSARGRGADLRRILRRPQVHRPLALAEIGEVAVHHGVALRPAAPAGFGFLAGGRIAFLLPGNPVSCSSLRVRGLRAGPTPSAPSAACRGRGPTSAGAAGWTRRSSPRSGAPITCA